MWSSGQHHAEISHPKFGLAIFLAKIDNKVYPRREGNKKSMPSCQPLAPSTIGILIWKLLLDKRIFFRQGSFSENTDGLTSFRFFLSICKSISQYLLVFVVFVSKQLLCFYYGKISLRVFRGIYISTFDSQTILLYFMKIFHTPLVLQAFASMGLIVS